MIHAVAQDRAFLDSVLRGGADDLHNSGEPRMKRLLSLLHLNPQSLELGIFRADWMLTDRHQPKLVEVNTISAAFLCGAPRVQRLHRQLMRRPDAPSLAMRGEPAPVTNSDVKAASVIASAHAKYLESQSTSPVLPVVVLFIVLADEHLLVESLLEQHVQEAFDIRVQCLTLPGCARRLSMNEHRSLILDQCFEVSVVYFRGGITDACYSEPGWASRELIERSMAIKAPSIAWLLAGSKLVQAALCDEAVIERLLPQLAAETRAELFAALTKGRVVGPNPKEASIEHPERKILKKERGVWVGEEMLQKLSELSSARQYMVYDKIEPVPVHGVEFIREGRAVENGPGVQELGTYGLYLGGEQGELHVECAGYLLRTKPEREVDGGVCKGVAVLDSLLLVD